MMRRFTRSFLFLVFLSVMIGTVHGASPKEDRILLQMEWRISLHPDSSGKMEGTVTLGGSIFGQLQLMESQGESALRDAAMAMVGLNKGGLLITRCRVVKEEDRFKIETTAYSGNLVEAMATNQGPVPRCTLDRQADGSFIFTFGNEGDPFTGSDEESKRLETMKKQVSDLRVKIVYVLPGEITRIDGETLYFSHQGRELRADVDVDKMIVLSQKARTLQKPITISKIHCAAAGHDAVSEFESFKKELDAARKDNLNTPKK